MRMVFCVCLGAFDAVRHRRFHVSRRNLPTIAASNHQIMRSIAPHWPEYAIEGSCLGLFMITAAGFASLLNHPGSPLAGWHHSPVIGRLTMGLAMGLTLVAIVYSRAGARSGAHMNPVVTLSYLRLGKIRPIDAAGYIASQFMGGAAGILLATRLFGGWPAHPSVNYIATVPGPAGMLVAFAAEAVISFGMFLMVLTVSNSAKLSRFTGICAGALVAGYITLEAPLSGMSMNPARTLGPALLAHTTPTVWIYFVAPATGMLLAAESFIGLRGIARVRCAKLHHPTHVRCIFNCGFQEAGATV
jgi:aquaporin Z